MKSRAEHPAHPAVWLSVLPSTRLLSVLGDQLLDKFSEFLSGHHQPTPIGRMLRCDWILARPPRERFMSGTWHEGRIGVITSSTRGSRKPDKIIRGIPPSNAGGNAAPASSMRLTRPARLRRDLPGAVRRRRHPRQPQGADQGSSISFLVPARSQDPLPITSAAAAAGVVTPRLRYHIPPSRPIQPKRPTARSHSRH